MSETPASMERRRDADLVFGVVLTLLVHCGVMALVLVGGLGEDPEAAEPVLLPVVATELLKWGEQMPDDGQLPELMNPSPAPRKETIEPLKPETETSAAPEEAVVLRKTPTPEAAKRTEVARSTETPKPNAAERPYRGENNPNRPINDGPIIGSPDGFVGGTSLSPDAVRNQLAAIQTQLQRAIKRPASISDDDLKRLKATYVVRVTPGGQIVGYTRERSSGNPLFDAACEGGYARFKLGSERLRMTSITDDALRGRMEREGFRVECNIKP